MAPGLWIWRLEHPHRIPPDFPDSLRFRNEPPDGTAKPGESVMGRQATEYDYQAKGSDGELYRQTWIDIGTGVSLRMKQTRISPTTRRTLECHKIDFGQSQPMSLKSNP